MASKLRQFLWFHGDLGDLGDPASEADPPVRPGVPVQNATSELPGDTSSIPPDLRDTRPLSDVKFTQS